MSDADDLELLHAAARSMDDLFEFELPDAPGMVFVGGRFSVTVDGRADTTFSAGAADENRQRAFRRCVAEMVETRAQFLAGRELPTVPNPFGSRDAEQAIIAELVGEAPGVLAWLPATRIVDGEPSGLPVRLCLRDPPGTATIANSLGCAAGRTLAEASVSALYELVERDALALWWRGGDPPAPIGPEQIPETRALLSHVRGRTNARHTRFLDITSDIGIPVVAAVSFDMDGRAMAIGFASRGSLDAAASAALRELAQMELGNRLILAKFERGGIVDLVETERWQLRRMEELLADDVRLRTGDRAQRNIDPVAADEVAIARRLGMVGIEAYQVELTHPIWPIPVVKVIAPLLQAEPGTTTTARLSRMRELRGYRIGEVSSHRLI